MDNRRKHGNTSYTAVTNCTSTSNETTDLHLVALDHPVNTKTRKAVPYHHHQDENLAFPAPCSTKVFNQMQNT